jgi:uncharacterized protein YjeT (DUF2065 family)
MWQELGVAVALVLIVEGILPFANPGGIRRLFASLSQMGDSQMRVAGLSSMVLGLVLLYILH